MKRLLIAMFVMLSGCGDKGSSLPIGVDLGSGVDDFKKRINIINEIDFPDAVPATLIKFDAPPTFYWRICFIRSANKKR